MKRTGFIHGGTLSHWTPAGPSAGECQRNPQVCGRGRCIPRPSGYTCACDSGFRLSPQGTHCIGEPGWVGRMEAGREAVRCHLLTSPSVPSDVDECRRVPTPCAPGRCENTPGSFRCVCGPGFRAGPRGTECLGEKSRPHPSQGLAPALPREQSPPSHAFPRPFSPTTALAWPPAPSPVSRPIPAPPLPLSQPARPSVGPAPFMFQTSACPLQGPSPDPQLL